MEIDGKKYVRASEILAPLLDFRAIPKDVLEKKALIGTLVHNFISEEINGNFPVLVASGKEVGYIKSFHAWKETAGVEFAASEVRYCCDKRRLTGCIDALVKLEGKKEAVLVDFKTSAQESPITWPMQAHLYYYLLTQSRVKVQKRFLFVKLHRYGKMPTVFQYEFDAKLLKRCLELVDEYWEIDSAVNKQSESLQFLS